MNSKQATAALILILMSQSLAAIEPHSEHTFRLSAGESSPAATLEDAAWLTGSWTGTAFGKQFEEAWNPPSAGSMIGLFKLYDEAGVALYELLLLDVQDGTLSLKVKHFNSDFTAWEDKGGYIDFRLVKVEENALHFSGLSFYRRDDDHIDGYIVIKEGDVISEKELKYIRAAQ